MQETGQTNGFNWSHSLVDEGETALAFLIKYTTDLSCALIRNFTISFLFQGLLIHVHISAQFVISSLFQGPSHGSTFLCLHFKHYLHIPIHCSHTLGGLISLDRVNNEGRPVGGGNSP